MTAKEPPLFVVLLFVGIFVLMALGTVQQLPEVSPPIGVTGYWQGDLGLQLGDSDDSKLILGLDLSLAQTESPGDITGRIDLATSTMYLSFDITQGKEEDGTVAFKAAGTAGGLPGSTTLVFEFTGTEVADGALQGTGIYSANDETYEFIWKAKRGESEGMIRSL